jgi:hypothetical protein
MDHHCRRLLDRWRLKRDVASLTDETPYIQLQKTAKSKTELAAPDVIRNNCSEWYGDGGQGYSK